MQAKVTPHLPVLALPHTPTAPRRPWRSTRVPTRRAPSANWPWPVPWRPLAAATSLRPSPSPTLPAPRRSTLPLLPLPLHPAVLPRMAPRMATASMPARTAHLRAMPSSRRYSVPTTTARTRRATRGVHPLPPRHSTTSAAPAMVLLGKRRLCLLQRTRTRASRSW